MTLGERAWIVDVTDAAWTDFNDIVRWTYRNFGPLQARRYGVVLTATMDDLKEGPTLLGLRPLPEIDAQLYTLHVARKGRRGSHVVLCRAIPDEQQPVMEVLRILYDGMDLERHAAAIPPRTPH